MAISVHSSTKYSRDCDQASLVRRKFTLRMSVEMRTVASSTPSSVVSSRAMPITKNIVRKSLPSSGFANPASMRFASPQMKFRSSPKLAASGRICPSAS